MRARDSHARQNRTVVSSRASASSTLSGTANPSAQESAQKIFSPGFTT